VRRAGQQAPRGRTARVHACTGPHRLLVKARCVHGPSQGIGGLWRHCARSATCCRRQASSPAAHSVAGNVVCEQPDRSLTWHVLHKPASRAGVVRTSQHGGRTCSCPGSVPWAAWSGTGKGQAAARPGQSTGCATRTPAR